MERTMIKELSKMIGKIVEIKGWVDTVREHGKIIFLEIRDISGTVQTVAVMKNEEVFKNAKKVSKESSVRVKGIVNSRPAGTENKNSVAGSVELKIEEFEILNLCPPLPFDLDNKDTSEEIRLKYRYLDLRRKEMQKNLLTRAKVIKIIRNHFDLNNFNEVETPMLVKSTPGGARNYLVPSRLEAGKFWALPESPQLFKQLLMVGGMERYYQIAKCLRDEDLRKDRQPEFTQLDVEMSFITQEDIISLIEKLIAKIWKEILNVDVPIPFKRMTYKDAMEKYGIDRPDLRPETKEKYAFLWVVDFPLFQYDKAEKKYVANHHPFTSPNLEDFKKDPHTARSVAYDIVLNGIEIGGGSIRIHNQEVQQKVFEILQISKEEQESKFKFLLDALKFGAPPHGGIALGIDRLMMMILETENIRDVVAFPKNAEGRDVMLEAPSEVTEKQLKELFIKIDAPKKELSKETHTFPNEKKVEKKKK